MTKAGALVGKETNLDDKNGEVYLQGRVLFTARTVWIVFFLLNLILTLFNLSMPLFGGEIFVCPITFTCPYSETTFQVLKYAHIPLAAYETYVMIFGLIYGLIFVGIGMLIFWRKSDQLVGLLASFAFIFLGFNGLLPNIGEGSTLPLAIQSIFGIVQQNLLELCLGFFLVTFPDGRLAPRWSWLIGCTLFIQALLFEIPGPQNILSWPLPLLVIELIFAYSSPIVILVYRYVRVFSLAQRRQTRWVIFGAACALLPLFGGFFIEDFFPPPSLYSLSGESLSSLAFLFIPVSVSIAILRSRLWDIDIIINRTLVYGSLTAILIGIYLLLVFTGQTLLVSILGQHDSVVLVVSTLSVAGLFQPLRLRVQQVVDRRFYRQKYDATRIVASFASTLHREIDLEQLNIHLLGVIKETMQPTHISLWLCPPVRPALTEDQLPEALEPIVQKTGTL